MVTFTVSSAQTVRGAVRMQYLFKPLPLLALFIFSMLLPQLLILPVCSRCAL